MSTLKVGILGLGRVGASVGLALQRYLTKGGKYQFERVGYDPQPDTLKQALKVQAVDKTTTQPHEAVKGADVVIMALSYDDVKPAYRQIAASLRDGVVILDASPLKQPSVSWAKSYLTDEHHLIGITPIVNPRYLFAHGNSLDDAHEDLFDQSTILITPSPSSIKEAVDLAFNFCTLLGSKPRFLDPAEHDALLAFTDGLPQLLGVALYHSLSTTPNWEDTQWLTNPAFGVLTRPLKDVHPDALRDVWLQNPDALLRALDTYLQSLQAFRQVIAEGNSAGLEAALIASAKSYEVWLNHRYKADWDDKGDPEIKAQHTFIGTLFGESVAKRLGGRKDD